MRTGRLKSRFLAVVTEGALESAAIFRIALDYAERTSNHAIGATIADVRLHVHSAEFSAHNRSRRTCFQAAGVRAVLANIGREGPGSDVCTVSSMPHFGSMLHELHVAPSRVSNGCGVVIGEAAPVVTICFEVIPFFACDFARLAADAERGIGEESCRGAHAVSLIFSFSSF